MYGVEVPKEIPGLKNTAGEQRALEQKEALNYASYYGAFGAVTSALFVISVIVFFKGFDAWDPDPSLMLTMASMMFVASLSALFFFKMWVGMTMWRLSKQSAPTL